MPWTYETLVDWVAKHPAPKDEEVDEDDWHIHKTQNYLEQLQQSQTKKDKLLNI